MNIRVLFPALALALVASGCSVIEPERRPISTGPREQSAPIAKPPAAIAASPVGAGPVWPLDAPPIYAKSAILIDAQTGQTLYQKNADLVRQVASTQKVLTALLVVEDGSLDDPVTIQSIDTAVEPTNLGVRAGQTYSRRTLLTAMMVKSCNDAAAALARDVAGSTPAFAARMNARAAQLGATSSHFANPHGLPASQFSTARDMARIAMRVYRSSELRAMMRQPGYRFLFTSGRARYLEATNKLLGVSPGINGMKTGFTNAAGRCLITSANLGGRDYILVQLGSKTSYIFNDAERLIQWAAARRGAAFFASAY